MTERANAEIERLNTFQALRKAVQEDMDKRLQRRLNAGKWQPTEMELELDAYQQEIEPQVWNAVKVMNRKGYKTVSSGFAGEYGERQQIDGSFHIDPLTKERLTRMGVSVLPYPDAYMFGEVIVFFPIQPDLPRITQKWNQITHLLPTRTKPRRNTR